MQKYFFRTFYNKRKKNTNFANLAAESVLYQYNYNKRYNTFEKS